LEVMETDPRFLVSELRVALREHAEALAKLEAAVERHAARYSSAPLAADVLRRHAAELNAAAECMEEFEPETRTAVKR
jgi:hypothetical protein